MTNQLTVQLPIAQLKKQNFPRLPQRVSPQDITYSPLLSTILHPTLHLGKNYLSFCVFEQRRGRIKILFQGDASDTGQIGVWRNQSQQGAISLSYYLIREDLTSRLVSPLEVMGRPYSELFVIQIRIVRSLKIRVSQIIGIQNIFVQRTVDCGNLVFTVSYVLRAWHQSLYFIAPLRDAQKTGGFLQEDPHGLILPHPNTL